MWFLNTPKQQQATTNQHCSDLRNIKCDFTELNGSHLRLRIFTVLSAKGLVYLTFVPEFESFHFRVSGGIYVFNFPFSLEFFKETSYQWDLVSNWGSKKLSRSCDDRWSINTVWHNVKTVSRTCSLTPVCQGLPRVVQLELLARCTVVDRSLGTTPAMNETNYLSKNYGEHLSLFYILSFLLALGIIVFTVRRGLIDRAHYGFFLLVVFIDSLNWLKRLENNFDITSKSQLGAGTC